MLTTCRGKDLLFRQHCWMETVSMTSSQVKKLEVTEMKMCRWACGHTLRDHVRNDNIRERLKVEDITERCRKARLRCEEMRPRIRRKKDSGDGITREKKKRKTEAEMDRQCEPRHESHRDNKRWSSWQNGQDENCVRHSDPTIKWERLEEAADDGENKSYSCPHSPW